MNSIILIFIIVNIILFVVSITLFIKGLYKNKNYNTLTGEIISLKKRQDMSDVEIDIISPVIKYLVNDKEYIFEGKYCSPKSKVGDKIEIFYDKNNPEIVSVKKGLFIAPIITGGIAIVFLVGLIIYFIIK